jgi:hypothetical protein
MWFEIVRTRVGGVQSDRLEFKESFDAFQVLRVEDYKKHNKQSGFFTLPEICAETFQINHTKTASVIPVEKNTLQMEAPKALTKTELMMQRMSNDFI